MDLGNFFQVPVNYLAVFLAGVSNMVIGFLWYGPLFGKPWMKYVGFTPEKLKKAQKNMGPTYGLMFVSALVMAYALFHFIWYAAPGSYTLFIAVKTAVWAWLGFIATTILSGFMFSPERKSYKLYFIDAGYYLAALVVMAVIIYLFK